MQGLHVCSAFDVSKQAPTQPPTPAAWEAIQHGLEALCGVTLGEGRSGAVVLREEPARRWTLEMGSDAAWTVRLDWTPALDTLRPCGAHALLRWRKLRDHFQGALGAGVGVAADAAQASVSLSVICDPRWVFVALTEVEALTGWLEEVQEALRASANPDLALDGWLARARVLRRGGGLIPTVGEVRWVEGGQGWCAGRLEEGLLVVLEGGLVEGFIHAVRRRFGLSPQVLEVPSWAWEVAGATGALVDTGGVLVRVRLQGVGEEEVLRLLKGLRARGLQRGALVVKREEGSLCR